MPSIVIKSGDELRQILTAKISNIQAEATEKLTVKIAENLGKKIDIKPIPIIDKHSGHGSIVINSPIADVPKNSKIMENELIRIQKLAKHKDIKQLFNELGII